MPPLLIIPPTCSMCSLARCDKQGLSCCISWEVFLICPVKAHLTLNIKQKNCIHSNSSLSLICLHLSYINVMHTKPLHEFLYPWAAPFLFWLFHEKKKTVQDPGKSRKRNQESSMSLSSVQIRLSGRPRFSVQKNSWLTDLKQTLHNSITEVRGFAEGQKCIVFCQMSREQVKLTWLDRRIKDIS